MVQELAIGTVERRVAPAGAPDLGRGELQLSVDEQARAGDQAVGQIGRERGGVGKDHAPGGVGQHQRTFGADLVGGLVVDDPVRPKHPALIEHLDVAGGDEKPGVAVVGHLVGDEGGRQVLAERRSGGQPRDQTHQGQRTEP